MVAGTCNSNIEGEPSDENSDLAALIASLVAQWTEAARRSGGSPEAAFDHEYVISE